MKATMPITVLYKSRSELSEEVHHPVCHVIDPGTVFHERINAEYRGKTRRDADNRSQNSENEMPAQASFNARPHSQQKYTYYQSVNDKVHITDPLYYSYIYYIFRIYFHYNKYFSDCQYNFGNFAAYFLFFAEFRR